jgi:hypothetical protein
VALYVYGVTSASSEIAEGEGIAGAPVALIAADGLGALVSAVPELELSMGRDALDAHARVLERAHEHDTVLPMRFGMIMADADEVVERLLLAHGAGLREQLAAFAGTVELRLRATYEEEPVLREIVRDDRDVARLRESLRGAPPDATYYGQIRLGELVAQAMSRKRDRDAAAILDELEPLALAVDVATPANERIVLAASFLVSRDRIGDFDAAVNEVGAGQAGRMRLKYTGPLPPHSFVNLIQTA